ncbi:MAG: SGNH/GDSL hydrolase family protein [Pseudomonadota bacterium]
MHGLFRSILAIGLLSLLGACAEPVSRHEAPRILAMGDSLLSWNRATGRSVAHGVEGLLNEPVVDRSVPGAHVIYALPISGSLGLKIDRQYRAGDWDWIILNGGGNDLWLGCGCGACDGRMGRMLTPDGASGAIAASVFRLRATGARVIYLGYLRSPGRGSPIEHCRDDGDELERRLARLAGRDPGITFVPIGDMVPYGDRSYHSFDMIHPSAKASAEIAARVVSVIRSGE